MAGQSSTRPYASLSVSDSGQLQPGTSIQTLPDKPCKLAKLKAGPDNTGRVSIGKLSTLTSGNTANGGLILSAREETGWIPVSNLNKLACISTVAADWLEWLILK